MAIYKGLLSNGVLVKANNAKIKVLSVSPPCTKVEFPTDVRLAYVQATNRFLDDRVTFGALTVWSVKQKPKELVFENRDNGAGAGLSFEVETTSARAPKKASKKSVR